MTMRKARITMSVAEGTTPEDLDKLAAEITSDSGGAVVARRDGAKLVAEGPEPELRGVIARIQAPPVGHA